jgi:adenosylcobinamide-GDP ribazoletransferase
VVFEKILDRLNGFWASANAALMFYTCLPIPHHWPLEFRWIARWVVMVGAVVGGLLAIVDGALLLLQMPALLSGVLLVAVGVVLTGGLHLDGVMDSADGLAVAGGGDEGSVRARRLAAMTDSRLGAFGGMAAILLILLKVSALAAIPSEGFAMARAFILVAVAMWGRWAQQWAIARYPYLKAEGKGAFHKAALPTVWHTLPGALGAIALSGLLAAMGIVSWPLVGRTIGGGLLFAGLTSAYFARQLGGHTGDTYGAVVEWTEALLLCSLAAGG